MVQRAQTGPSDERATDREAPLFLTFVFADIRGWTRFTRERGAAAAGRLAKTFADLSRDAVEARGGEVFELRGDEVDAVFESPTQAVRAAVELQQTFAEVIAEDPTLPLLAGIGIDAGEVVRVEDGFRGSPLNMAGRLCSIAAAGQVLASPSFATLAQDVEGIVFEDGGTATLKGFEGATPFFEALATPPRTELTFSIDHPSEPGDLELATDMPLVGRDHEMRWARGTWRRVRRGFGHVVCVSGPSQIGKTRLAAEIAGHVDASGGTVRYAGAGGTAIADALVAVNAAAGTQAPTLVILDDLDAVEDEVAAELADRLDEIGSRPALVLLLVQNPDASPALSEVVRRIDVRGDAHLTLQPLDQGGVGEIGRAYVGDDIEHAPIEAFFRSSGGVPGRIHEVIGRWAGEEATRRLSAAAEWLAAGRTRRADDLQFANNVLGLKLDQLFQIPAAVLQEQVEACPYKGLAAFKDEDAALFFGRERLVGELAARSVDVGLLGVVGASGSGKSSAVAAGLLPSLAAALLPGSDRWPAISMRPGERPMDEFARAVGAASDRLGTKLDGMNERLLLVVDQFEETFTLCTDEAEREAFVDAITGLALVSPDRAIVVLILRADFYGHCAAYPDLARLLGENHVLVGPMSKDELRRAIELPARRVGLRVESALTERLVDEVVDEPGGLPLLSTALVELWQQREGHWLRAEAYERTGGVHGAVTRLAESTYTQLSEEQKEAAPGVLLRLVGYGEGESVTRRRVALSAFDLASSPTTAAVIDRFVTDRLLTSDEDTVEVAHEALLWEWPRLQGWLADDVQGRELRTHLATASRTWEDSGEEDSELYRGARLSATLDWAATHDRQLNDPERRFLTAGRQAAERLVERQRRTNRRLRGLLIGVAAFLVVALIAGSVALVQRSRARAADRAATAQRLGAEALQQQDLDLSLLLARQGVALDDSALTDRNAALVSSPAAIKVLHPLPGIYSTGVLSYDGSRFAVGNSRIEGAVIDTSDSATYRTIGSLPGQPLAFSTDGRIYVDRPGPGTTSIVDPETGERHDLDKAYGGVRLNAWINPDFSEFAIVAADHSSVTFWDPDTITRTGRIHPQDGQIIWYVAYSYDGRYLITVEQATTMTGPLSFVLHDAVTHRFEKTATTVPADLDTWDASRDGTWLVFGFQDGSVSAVNVASGRKVTTEGQHEAPVDSVIITPDDAEIVSGGDDAAIKFWDLGSGDLLDTFTGHASSVLALAVSPDNSTLYSVGIDGSVIVWDLEGSRRLGVPFTATHGGMNVNDGYPPVPDLLSMSPKGDLFATPQCDGKVLIHDVTTFRVVQSLPVFTRHGACGQSDPPDRYRQPYDAAFTPDGERIVVGAPRGSVTMWDVRSGRPYGPTFSGPRRWIHDPEWKRLPDGVEAVAVSPDGAIVAAGTDEGRIYLWDASTGVSIRSPIHVPKVSLNGSDNRNWVYDLAFSSDGTMLAAGHGSAASVWSTSDWSLRYTVQVDEAVGAVYTVGFSPDGSLLAAAGGTNSLRLWAADTGAPYGSVPVDTTYTVSLSWSPDSSTIVTAGWDGADKLVDVASKSVIGSLPGPTHLYNTVAFTPDGNSVFVVYEETGQGIRWQLAPASWAQRACEVAGRTLTLDEWNRFLPGVPYDPACVS